MAVRREGVPRTVVSVAGGLKVSGTYVADEVQGEESLCKTNWKVLFIRNPNSNNEYTTQFRGKSDGYGKHPVKTHTEFTVKYSPATENQKDGTLTFTPLCPDEAEMEASALEMSNVSAKQNVWIKVVGESGTVDGTYWDWHHGAPELTGSRFVDMAAV